MDITLPDYDLERKTPLERLDTILQRLPDAERAEAWRGLALNMAEKYGEGKP